MPIPKDNTKLEKAKSLRREMTPHERKLWYLFLRTYPVKIYKATPENSPFGNPVPCDDDGTPIIASADDPRLKEWKPVYEGRA